MLMVKIKEFDEYQGLTADMVRAWLTSHGARQSKEGNWWFGDKLFSNLALGSDYDIERIRTLAGYKSLPSLLREINPRMRKGMPSDAALAEHDEWIVCTPFGATFIAEISYGGSDDGFSIMMPPINDHCDAEFIAEKHWPECLFWPCDANGNKVRWPTDAHGNML